MAENVAERRIYATYITSVFVVSLHLRSRVVAPLGVRAGVQKRMPCCELPGAGNADTVRAMLASPNVDVNGIDEHGNTH